MNSEIETPFSRYVVRMMLDAPDDETASAVIDALAQAEALARRYGHPDDVIGRSVHAAWLAFVSRHALVDGDPAGPLLERIADAMVLDAGQVLASDARQMGPQTPL